MAQKKMTKSEAVQTPTLVQQNMMEAALNETENRVDLMLLCDHFSLDAQGKPSFIGVFGNINVPMFPYSLTRFFFIVNIANFNGDELDLVLSLPDTKTITLGSMNMQDIKGNFNASWEVSNTIFADPGAYRLIVKVDGKSIAEQILTANLTIEQQQMEHQNDELRGIYTTPDRIY